ncbi:MAG: NAD-dependent epimerase/dehydratase family protein [Bryobacteraceae bacterium]|nr:NAD-dependent epimerase/dehydratase family protein [Bryobacteraceae bacterium]MDW8378505.1 NAD-dependent epimerase/dehydratase family protein [Bryobacterales bacterium]
MIFLIGGRGFVGSAFARWFAQHQVECVVIDRQNYSEFVGRSCKLLINANGNSRKPLARQRPMEDFDASVRSVRASLLDFRFERYIYLSSCDVYPDCSCPESTVETAALAPSTQSPYGFHKYLAEQCVQHAASDWLIFRLGGFVGPGLKKNAIYDILQGGPLWLDPRSELQFLHTDDAARIILSLAEQTTREVFNLCGQGVVCLKDVIAHLGRDVLVQPGSPVVRYNVSISKISQYAEIPRSAETVFRFVDGSLEHARPK